MKKKHPFLFEPGYWYGEGTVTFSASDESLSFLTEWEVKPGKGDIHSLQTVKLEGSESRDNQFRVYDITDKSFSILLENEIVGKVSGTGIINDKTIAWEFREQVGFQGYEVYEVESDEVYKFHAEYCSPDQFRTIIDGYLKKTPNRSS